MNIYSLEYQHRVITAHAKDDAHRARVGDYAPPAFEQALEKALRDDAAVYKPQR